jgi:hypothetical protein
MCLSPIPIGIRINLNLEMGQVEHKLMKHVKHHVFQGVINEGIFFSEEQFYAQISVGMYNFAGRAIGHEGESKLKLQKSYY